MRQCDGSSVQCLVLVRDDFYASLNRFFQQLEVPIVEEHNSALVDLFDVDHARKVLTAIGMAYGKLPETPAKPSEEQTRFLHHAVEGLADEGKVICVRLGSVRSQENRPRRVGSLEMVSIRWSIDAF